MLLLAQAVPLNWVVYTGPFHYYVEEKTSYAKSEVTRYGTTEVRIASRDREWNNLEAVTTWKDARKNKETVWFQQNTETGAMRCVWVKGTERAHTFDPPLPMWSGEDSSGVQITPTFRPFGWHTVVAGKSQGYLTPVMSPTPVFHKDTKGLIGISYDGDTSWKGGDQHYPITYTLSGKFIALIGAAKDPGIEGYMIGRIRRVNWSKETISETSPQGTKDIRVTEYQTLDTRFPGQ